MSGALEELFVRSGFVMSPILDRIVWTDCGMRKRTSQLIQERDKLKGAGQASWYLDKIQVKLDEVSDQNGSWGN
uniref:Uncharacterized protein n=1 Tax=Brassica oleracea var. oleracea TaxID=109376 RepID=A0A0D3CNP7_BRAOL